ncbi:MAG: hypothetical protein ACI88H_002329 [Cocleimonas sp.]|jgi:hypothetical protein
MNYKTPIQKRWISHILLTFVLLLASSQVQAAMYKYITKDGQTLLTGKKLKGGGHKLVKIFQIKKSGAYKNSSSKKTNKNKIYKKKKNSKRSYKKSRKNKSIKRKSFGNLIKANGRDNGIIIGCGDSGHLNKQARVYQKPIQIYSRIYDVDEELIHAIVKQESCFNEGAHSRVGAIGLMQLMPQTALGLRINDPWNPEHNIQGGIKYIAKMLKRFDGDYKLAIAAYNAGPGNVRKYNGIPPFKETRNYVVKVYGEYKRLKKEGISYNKKIQLASN